MHVAKRVMCLSCPARVPRTCMWIGSHLPNALLQLVRLVRILQLQNLQMKPARWVFACAMW